jgi:hypothetical protein
MAGANHRKCCCQPQCPQCAADGVPTPGTWLVTFTGIAECFPGECILDVSLNGTRYTVLNLNQSFCLTQPVPGLCHWEFVDATSTYYEQTLYNTTPGSCDGPGTVVQQGIRISLDFAPDGAVAHLRMDTLGATQLFYHALTADERQCVADIVASSSVACGGFRRFGGGSVVATPGGC